MSRRLYLSIKAQSGNQTIFRFFPVRRNLTLGIRCFKICLKALENSWMEAESKRTSFWFAGNEEKLRGSPPAARKQYCRSSPPAICASIFLPCRRTPSFLCACHISLPESKPKTLPARSQKIYSYIPCVHFI